MAQLIDSGHGYDYLPGPAQYSAAVRARQGYELVRIRLVSPVVHELAFEVIANHLDGLGLPRAALAAVELRSPEPFTDEGFAAYNDRYRTALDQLGIDVSAGNPIARSNLCPVHNAPTDVAVHAFTYAAPVTDESLSLVALDRTFVISGSAEVPEGGDDYTARIIARGDVSSEGLERKVRWVVTEMGRRLGEVGANWDEVTGVHVYSAREVGDLIASQVQAPTQKAVSWYACTPPIVELEFEMDCRRVGTERVLDPAVS